MDVGIAGARMGFQDAVCSETPSGNHMNGLGFRVINYNWGRNCAHSPGEALHDPRKPPEKKVIGSVWFSENLQAKAAWPATFCNTFKHCLDPKTILKTLEPETSPQKASALHPKP